MEKSQLKNRCLRIHIGCYAHTTFGTVSDVSVTQGQVCHRATARVHPGMIKLEIITNLFRWERPSASHREALAMIRYAHDTQRPIFIQKLRYDWEDYSAYIDN